MDEGVCPPITLDTSPYCKMVVIVATPETINEGKLPKDHPVHGLFCAEKLYPMSRLDESVRMGKEDEVKAALQQWCMMALYAPPPFLLMAVAKGIASKMPQDLILHRVRCSKNSLYERSGVNREGGGVSTISLEDLVLRLSDGIAGGCLDAGSRLLLRSAFTNRETFDTDALRSALDQIQDRVGERANMNADSRRAMIANIGRLNERITGLIEGSTDCPICLEPMEAHGEHAGSVMTCCTAQFHPQCVLRLTRCPTCRKDLKNQGQMRMDFVSPVHAFRQSLAQMDMEQRIRAVSAKNLSKPQCVVAVIKDCILLEIPNARIILAFSFDQRGYGDGNTRYQRVLQGLRQDVPSATVINASELANGGGRGAGARSADEILHAFSHVSEGDDTPQILVINSGADSETAAGVAADADYMVNTPSRTLLFSLFDRCLCVRRSSAMNPA